MIATEIGDAVVVLWGQGGPLMGPITLLAFVIYLGSLALWFRLLSHPMASRSGVESLAQSGKALAKTGLWPEGSLPTAKGWALLREDTDRSFQRRVRMLGQFTKAAPLLGLLGTVGGMLSTFEGMKGLGLSQSEDMAAGISMALITTQYGLLVAIPGMVLLTMIRSRMARIQRNMLCHERVLAQAEHTSAVRGQGRDDGQSSGVQPMGVHAASAVAAVVYQRLKKEGAS
jgi:biopolymer transport protein ExbB